MASSHPAFLKPRRWAVLSAYTLVVGVSQMLWLNFAPLLTLMQTRYGVSELMASMLVLVFPLLYVVFSIHSGTMTDTRGYRFTVGVGALGMALFSCLRIIDSSFGFLLAGQVGIAVAQPYVVNGISKLVADWFSEEQGAIATGLGTMGMFLGMAAGMAATPALVETMGLRLSMVVFAAISVVAAIVFAVLVHPNTGVPEQGTAGEATGLRPLLGNRKLVRLCWLAFLGLGVFNGLTTWLEQILAPRGIDAEKAGIIGGALIVGGIVGSVIIPAMSDLAKRRKPFLVACSAAALATMYPLCTSSHYGLLLLLACLHGFCFLPAFALLLEMSAQVAGARAAGAATSLLMLAGNVGGVVVIVAMPLVKGEGSDFRPAVVLMVALLALTTVLAMLAPETFSQAIAETSPSPLTRG
ncbi:MFS transporter [Hyalangium versicolor]|uniref:MFS transporter n=1 Tax=Hyalangium versicolor TaxID=2861190 RepID=UPI001CCB73C2|nr:MFS transporter [Hyalangium versicolor]